MFGKKSQILSSITLPASPLFHELWGKRKCRLYAPFYGNSNHDFASISVCFGRLLTPLHHAKSDSANMHKVCGLKVTILGWLHDILQFFNNSLIQFILNQNGRNLFYVFMTSDAEADVNPIAFIIKPVVKNLIIW